LVFDPDNLENIDVRVASTSYGKAVPSRLRRHVHPKAAAGPISPPAPTGIDYLRLIEARHTHSLENRLQYSHLDHASDPDPENPMTTPPNDDGTDDEAAQYETDLVALADLASPTQSLADPVGPVPDTIDPLPVDPMLEAELAGFAALLAHHHTDPDDSAVEDPVPGTTPGDSDADGGTRGSTRGNGTREAS
jgi:hypothetical protein